MVRALWLLTQHLSEAGSKLERGSGPYGAAVRARELDLS